MWTYGIAQSYLENGRERKEKEKEGRIIFLSFPPSIVSAWYMARASGDSRELPTQKYTGGKEQKTFLAKSPTCHVLYMMHLTLRKTPVEFRHLSNPARILFHLGWTVLRRMYTRPDPPPSFCVKGIMGLPPPSPLPTLKDMRRWLRKEEIAKKKLH